MTSTGNAALRGTLRPGAMAPRCVVGPFDVRSPPIKKHMVAGHMVPTLKTATWIFNNKHRRLTLEIFTPKKDSPVIPTAFDPENEMLNDEDRVVFRIFRWRKSKKGKETSDHDGAESSGDESISTIGSNDDGDGNGNGKEWREHRRYRLEDLQILKVHGKTIDVQLGAGNDTVIRDFKFESTKDAESFESAVKRLVLLEKERAKRHIAKYKEQNACTIDTAAKATSPKISPRDGEMVESPRGISDTILEALDDDEVISILCEIVSARDLPIADITSTDPYVIVRMKGTEVHRTGVISKNLSPIWTLETGSLFLLQRTPEEFFASSSGLSFILKDYDAVGSNEILGSVHVPPAELLSGKGDRIEYEIVPDAKSPKSDPNKKGKLYLRFKKASEDDINFLEAFKNRSKKFGVYAGETFVPIRQQHAKFLRRQEKGGFNKERLFRVKPEPDPDRPEDETKWLTEKQIQDEAMKLSTHWIEAGSGDIGKLYVELIGCDGLPNMDATTLNLLDKTDAFACMVFEDCVVNTDVIGDSLSPRWPCWCQRAFAFNIAHPASHLLIGIFDHDPEMSPGQLIQRAAANVHDAIGRIVVNVTHFKPGTSYLLTYPLYYGELKEHRLKARGTVTIRLFIDYSQDVRKALIRGMQPPPENVVSVARQIDYEVAQYTTDGVVDDLKFSLNTLTGYIEELQSYQLILEIIKEAVMVVWLWRGHYKTIICGKEVKLPLHSITAFTWGILVSWNYNLFPSFLMFSIGWVLLACNDQVQKHPSRWHHPPSYHEILLRLIYNHCPPENVTTGADAREITLYEEKMEKLRLRREADKKKEEEHELALQAELGEELEMAEEAEKLGGKDHGLFGIENPLKGVLYPIQKQLRDVVMYLRIAKSIVLWSESYYSFWIVTASFSLCIVICWIPWGFIFRWLLRVVIFLALGPWMALVDRYYFKTNPGMTEEKRDEELRHRLRARYEEALASATNLFIRKERAVKMKSMKKYMFGKHLLRVPRFREDLFDDIPLPTSSGKPAKVKEIKFDSRKFGQSLSGDMIPMREIQAEKVEKVESHPKPAKKSLFWQRKGHKTDESTPLLNDNKNDKKGDYKAISPENKTKLS